MTSCREFSYTTPELLGFTDITVLNFFQQWQGREFFFKMEAVSHIYSKRATEQRIKYCKA